MKKKTNISDKALKLINQNKIKPIPKWEFVFKNWGLWLVFLSSLILLILGISVSWFGLTDKIITPYFWLFIALVFLILSYLIFEKTKKAYRFTKWQIIVFIGIIGLTVGGILFKIGLGSSIDRKLESNLSFYRQVVPMKITAWNNPESGYLSGKIIDITSYNSFKIKDFNGKLWIIDGEDQLIRGRVQMVIGEEIKLIGTKTSDSTFRVDEIRPWSGMGQNMMKEN